MEITRTIINRLYLIFGGRVMIDRDLAFLDRSKTDALYFYIIQHIDRSLLDLLDKNIAHNKRDAWVQIGFKSRWNHFINQ